LRDKLTVKEAATYLGTTRQKISRLLKNGALKSEDNPLDNRYKLIDLVDLDRLKVYGKYLIEDEVSEESPKNSGQEQDNPLAA
jgi:transcriptional regulator with XRE-family HTH domain